MILKRLFDFWVSFFGLVLLSPFLLLCALLVKAFDRGPVFFVQERVGYNGESFRMFKFRTMRVNNSGSAITIGSDQRITSIGRVLRRFKIDELPQLWNVLRGEMSFVGPRPEVRKYVEMYNSKQLEVLLLKPGITDLASFAFFDESDLLASAPNPEAFYIQEVMPEKIRINLEYADRANFFVDLYLILATVLRSVGIKFNLFRRLDVRPPLLRIQA